MSEYITETLRTGDLTQMVLQKYGTDFGKDAKYTALTQVRGSTGWGDNSDTTAAKKDPEATK